MQLKICHVTRFEDYKLSRKCVGTAMGLKRRFGSQSLQRSLRLLYARHFDIEFPIRQGHCFADCRYGAQFLCRLPMGEPLLIQGLIPTKCAVPSAKMLKGAGLSYKIVIGKLIFGLSDQGIAQTLPGDDLPNRTPGLSDHVCRRVGPVVSTEPAVQIVLGRKTVGRNEFLPVSAEQSNIPRL